MLLNSSGEGNLLANLCACRAGELQPCGISLDSDNLGTGSGGANVDHEDFVLCQLGNLGLLAIGSLDTEETAEKEVVDLNLSVDGRELSTETKDETNKTIGTAEGWVNTSTHTWRMSATARKCKKLGEAYQ